MLNIPILNLQANSDNSREIVTAFRSVGFAYLEGHGVDQGLQLQLEAIARKFFSQPENEKLKFEMKNAGMAWRGYFPVGGELTSGKPDRKEGFYFGVDHPASHPNVKGGIPTFGLNLWPDEETKTAVTAYMGEMKKLSYQIMSLIAGGLGLSENFFLKSFTDEPTEFFRIFVYPKQMIESKEDDWGVREHTDMGFLTILKQDQSGGLQAKMVNGEWVDVPPRENAFVINIGDMLEFWTGGVLRSTPHRVRNYATGERYSFPYFFDPNWQTSLRPIDPDLLSNFEKPLRVAKRWDNLELHALSANSTYGDFVWQKIKHVFPKLAGT